MKNQFVSFEIAKQLKDLGFDKPCLFMYDKCEMFSTNLNSNQRFSGVNYNSSGYCCSAPLYQQVEEWLTKKYDIIIFITPIKRYLYVRQYSFMWEIFEFPELSDANENNCGYTTALEARKQAILAAIKFIKK